MDQTMGGAVMTSLHGAQFHMFTDDVVAMRVVLANGTVLRMEGDDVHWWTSSMGMLGVVVRLSLHTSPLLYVDCRAAWTTLDDAIAGMRDDEAVGYQGITHWSRPDAEDDVFVSRCVVAADAARSWFQTTS